MGKGWEGKGRRGKGRGEKGREMRGGVPFQWGTLDPAVEDIGE